MLRMTLLLALMICSGVQAQKHEHGKAELDASVEGSTFTAELRAPADTIFGFERAPRSDKERKAVAEAIDRLKTKSAELIFLPSEAGCRFLPAKASVHSESNGHQDVEAVYQAQCARPLTTGEIRFAFGKLFPGIRELAVQLVAPKHQTAKTLMNGTGAIRIAP